MGRFASKSLAFSALALLALAASAGVAKAADHDWSGPYVGLNAGYAWGQTNAESILSPFTQGGTPYQSCWYECQTWQAKTSGFTGGGQAGWNVQWNSFVFGLEGDVGYLGLQGSAPFHVTTFLHTNGGVYADARFRAGYAFGQALVYGTAGVIGADLNSSVSDPTYNVHTNTTGFVAGPIVGGGLEYAINDSWSIKGEYLYFELPSTPVSGPYSYNYSCDGGCRQTGTPTFNIKNSGNIVRLGINFHFWTPTAPIAAAAPPPMPVAAPAPAPVAQPRLFIVFFDFDKYNLTPDARKVVEEAANAYKSGGSAKVTLAGYTDLSGPAGYNMKLSERRAKAVAAAMVKLGVPESAMDVSWHGKENPRVPTPDGVREPQNRRVEISE